MREAGTRAEKIKELGGSRKGFLLLPQPRSQAPLRVGEEPGNQVPFPLPSPYLPLFVCLFVFVFVVFFSLASSFCAITRAVTVATRAHLEVESFVTGYPNSKQTV